MLNTGCGFLLEDIFGPRKLNFAKYFFRFVERAIKLNKFKFKLFVLVQNSKLKSLNLSQIYSNLTFPHVSCFYLVKMPKIKAEKKSRIHNDVAKQGKYR